MLAEIAKIYDPLGLISPVVVSLKIIMQLLWVLGLSWNDIVPDNIYKKLYSIHSILTLLNNLQCEPWKWKPFASHRTAKILDVLPRNNWVHVRSENNPADLASRGLNPSDLLDNVTWWHGPDFMRRDLQLKPESQFYETTDEMKPNVCLQTSLKIAGHILHKYSTLNELKNVVCWCLRWKNRKLVNDKMKEIQQ